MIPFAAAACTLLMCDGSVEEVSLQDMSIMGFSLRIPFTWQADWPEHVRELRLCFHDLYDDVTCMLTLPMVQIQQDEDEAMCRVWRIETDDSSYRSAAKRFMQAYQQYVTLKQAGDDAKLSQTLVGYPAEEEQRFPISLAAQRQAWFADLKPDELWQQQLAAVPELAVSLAEPALWQRWLTMEPAAFSAWYWQVHGLANHPIASRRFDCIYIGNQFCPLLFPEDDTLQALLAKAAGEGIRPVLVLSAIPEHQVDAVLAKLEMLAQSGVSQAPHEIVVNDWGMFALIHERWPAAFTLTLGVLLQKRRKDVRMPYMQGFGGKAELLRENAANASFFRDFLRAQGVACMSVEACGYLIDLPDGPVSLHLPFYQMSTAGTCTLYATCVNGRRSRQQQVLACPHYCAQQTYLYPEMLGMAARYNTLFGYDRRCLCDGAYMQPMASPQVQRWVIDLL